MARSYGVRYNPIPGVARSIVWLDGERKAKGTTELGRWVRIGKDSDDGWSPATLQAVRHDHPIGIGKPKKPEKMHPEHGWASETD